MGLGTADSCSAQVAGGVRSFHAPLGLAPCGELVGLRGSAPARRHCWGRREGTHRSLSGKGWPTDIKAEGLHWLFGGNPQVSEAPSAVIWPAGWEGRPCVAGWRPPLGMLLKLQLVRRWSRGQRGVQPATCCLPGKEPRKASWSRPRGTQPSTVTALGSARKESSAHLLSWTSSCPAASLKQDEGRLVPREAGNWRRSGSCGEARNLDPITRAHTRAHMHTHTHVPPHSHILTCTTTHTHAHTCTHAFQVPTGSCAALWTVRVRLLHVQGPQEPGDGEKPTRDGATPAPAPRSQRPLSIPHKQQRGMLP